MRWDPPDSGQTRLRDEFLTHLERGGSSLRRDGHPAHLTAGVVVLDPGLRWVLLTHHRKAGAWFQFGGHLESGDDTVHAAAAREAGEESGLADLDVRPGVVHLDRHVLPASFRPCREHLDVRFAAIAPTMGRPSVGDESTDVRWWPVNGLPPGAAADLGALVAAATAHLRAEPAPAAGVPCC
ncbi:MAG: NUDIX domain-containing protein [Intrasporangium sp.]|uniref:NUDIX domain-containing protein n=1 Tax=Intrasporangium sp. TaxID=1925024 RepID=UPI002649C091|nr:NUDIX domain-containing protein [Intrasporangium sp.]MDN5796731.1 NUDIX domain-containing protein [Intrasporangium sp.]